MIKPALSVLTALTFLTSGSLAFSKDIIHDAEYYIIEAQNGEQWASDDVVISEKLADFRKTNGGKPPNFIYILLDDVGFGEIGSKELSVVLECSPNFRPMIC